jgi:hypothetical protein
MTLPYLTGFISLQLLETKEPIKSLTAFPFLVDVPHVSIMVIILLPKL